MEIIKLESIQIKQHNFILNSGSIHYSAEYMGAKGFGSDFDRELALKKAINELFERIHFRSAGKSLNATSSTGFAVHDSVDQAIESSVQELIERDAVMVTWLTKSAPQWMRLSDFHLNGNIQKLASSLQQHFDLSVGILAKTGAYFTIFSLLRGYESFGLICSAAAAQSPAKAIENTLLELSRGTEMLLSRKYLGAKLYKNLKKSEVKTPADHLEFYLNPKNIEDLHWLFQGRQKYVELPFCQPISIPLDTLLSPPWPISVCHSFHDDYQKFVIGVFNKNLVNMNRIAQSDLTLKLEQTQNIHYLP